MNHVLPTGLWMALACCTATFWRLQQVCDIMALASCAVCELTFVIVLQVSALSALTSHVLHVSNHLVYDYGM